MKNLLLILFVFSFYFTYAQCIVDLNQCQKGQEGRTTFQTLNFNFTEKEYYKAQVFLIEGNTYTFSYCTEKAIGPIIFGIFDESGVFQKNNLSINQNEVLPSLDLYIRKSGYYQVVSRMETGSGCGNILIGLRKEVLMDFFFPNE